MFIDKECFHVMVVEYSGNIITTCGHKVNDEDRPAIYDDEKKQFVCKFCGKIRYSADIDTYKYFLYNEFVKQMTNLYRISQLPHFQIILSKPVVFVKSPPKVDTDGEDDTAAKKVETIKIGLQFQEAFEILSQFVKKME